MTKKVVIDSSVALKWWLDDEEFVDEARSLLKEIITGEIELIVPELWFYEITNGINTAVKRERITKEMAKDFIEELKAVTVTLIPAVNHLTKVYEEASKYNYAIYDMVYMVIAENENIPLLIADDKFIETVKNDKTFVVHLSDYRRII